MSDTATEAIISIELPTPEITKGEREYQAFLRLLPQLLATHRGKYVAVHESQVADSDSSDVVLILRMHWRVGHVPIHVGLVTEQQPVLRLPHYREYRRGNA